MRRRPGQQRREPALVGGVGVGVQQADRHHLDPLIAEQRREAPRLGLVERDQDAARVVDALGHLEPQRPRHDRGLPARQVEAVQVIALLPADLQHVAEPPRRDQGGPRPPPLQHRVGRHGRAVGQAGDLLVRPEQDTEPFQHRLGGIAGRQDLLHPQRPAGQRLRHQIGEGAADIDADPDLRPHGPAPYEESACRR